MTAVGPCNAWFMRDDAEALVSLVGRCYVWAGSRNTPPKHHPGRKDTPLTAVATTERDLGEGLYSLADLRVYLSLTGRPADGGYALDWLTDALNPGRHRRHRPDYSFADLVSLFVVRELKKKGVKTGDIREAERYLQRKWNTERPFTSSEIQTDGRGIFVDDDLIAGQLEAAERSGQQVIREAVKERLTYVHYEDGIAAYWTPAQDVLIDPRVQFGEPVIAGTRIPTGAVADMANWEDVAGIASDLALKPQQVKAAISFERQLAALHN